MKPFGHSGDCRARCRSLAPGRGRRDLERAEAERDQAQAAADAIPEKRASLVLKALYEQAEARRQAEVSSKRGGCGDRCQDAEKLAEQALAAMSQAEARERAETRAREAQQRADAARAASERGPAEVSGMAGLAEDIAGIDKITGANTTYACREVSACYACGQRNAWGGEVLIL